MEAQLLEGAEERQEHQEVVQDQEEEVQKVLLDQIILVEEVVEIIPQQLVKLVAQVLLLLDTNFNKK